MIEYIQAKTILSKTKQSNKWFGIDYNLNLYRGCNHGCIYCDSRSDVYQISDFDKVKVKKNALILLENELIRKRQKGVVSLGSMSDTYNHLEKDLKLTRQTISLLIKYGFGLSLETKSNLILRDIDLLKQLSKNKDVIIKITITDSDDQRAKLIEPNATSSMQRFETVKQLNEAGIYTGILMMPIIPFYNDTIENIQSIVMQAAQAKAKFIYPMFGVTLRAGQKEYFLNKLKNIDIEAYKLVINSYHNEYIFNSKHYKELYQKFCKLCDKYQIKYKMEDIINDYKKPQDKQLTLF